MNGWFPQISPDGKHVASGFGQIWVDDRLVGDGFGAQWLDNASLIFTNPTKRQIFQCEAPWTPFAQPNLYKFQPTTDFNYVVARGGRVAVVWRGGITLDNGSEIAGGYAAALNNAGALAYLTGAAQPTQTLWFGNAEIVDRGALGDVHLAGEALTWTRFESGRRNSWGMLLGTSHRIQKVQASWDSEFDCVPVDTPNGVWLLSYDDSRLFLRPWGQVQGIVVTAGVTDAPHAMWTDGATSGTIRVVWSRQGTLMERFVALTEPRVDLSLKPPPPPPPPPVNRPPAINVTYFDNSGRPRNWHLQWLDENHPGYGGSIHCINGKLQFGYRTPTGEDYASKERPIT